MHFDVLIHILLTSYILPSHNYCSKLGDNCIQNFHLGRYIVVYTVINLVLRRRVGGAVKRDENENFEYGYPHSNTLLTFFPSKGQRKCTLLRLYVQRLSCIKPLASCMYSLVNQWKATLHNDVRFPTVYPADSISQDILSQIYDVIQSDVALHLQVH